MHASEGAGSVNSVMPAGLAVGGAAVGGAAVGGAAVGVTAVGEMVDAVAVACGPPAQAVATNSASALIDNV